MAMINIKVDDDVFDKLLVGRLIESLECQREEVEAFAKMNKPQTHHKADLVDALTMIDALEKVISYFTTDEDRKELGLNW